MKISRSYLLGLGSGLILSALIAMVVPPVSINIAGGPAVNQGADQGANQETNKGPNPKNDPKSNQESNQDRNITNNENPGGQTNDNNLGAKGNQGVSTDQKDKGTQETEKNQGVFTIPNGSTADRIADLLLAEGWISSKEEFLDLVKERNLASRFRAGSFKLTQGMGVEEILEKLIP